MSGDQATLAFQSCLTILSTCTGIINFMTFTMFVKFRKKLLTANSHNRILCSMSFADTLVGCFGTTLGILLSNKSPRVYYKLAGNIPLFSSMFASVGSLSILTIDRLIALRRPHLYRATDYKRMNLKMIIATWIIPVLINIQQTVIYVVTRSGNELKVRGMLLSVIFGIGVITLVISNIVLYLGVRKYLRGKEVVQLKGKAIKKEVASDKTASSTDRAFTNSELGESFELSTIVKPNMSERMQHKANKEYSCMVKKNRELWQTSFLCILAVVSFVLLWTPLAVYRLCYAVGYSLQLTWFKRLCLCLTITNSLLNPGIYFIFRKKFHAHFIAMFACSKNCRK